MLNKRFNTTKTLDELIASAKRELTMRKKVYSSSSSLTPKQKQHELTCTEEIIKILQTLKDEADAEAGTQETLF